MKKYTDIQGWFAEEAFYARMVREAAAGARFAEVGCWLGKSTCFLAQTILDSGKDIILYAVDTWQGSPLEPELVDFVAKNGGSVFGLFKENMDAAGVSRVIKPVVGPSPHVASAFADLSLDFVFVDGAHDYASVRADILAWQPKVKRGGILAGHDWCVYGSVQMAVVEVLGTNFVVEGNCWVSKQ